MKGDEEARALLVELLKQAARLEHCLLNTYLYTACSLKSMPGELAEVAGRENRRRAIQFERVRSWKSALLSVAHEEMLHLHYVQCMLRALGEPPEFMLPKRSERTGNWIVPNWRASIAGKPLDGEGGVEVPVQPLTTATIRRFVVYESTDALQDEDPFGPEATALFEELHAFEVDFRFESALFDVADPEERKQMKARLEDLYTTLTPIPEDEGMEMASMLAKMGPLPSAEELQFQSIADFYEQGILPLYREAFDLGWVTHNDRNLSDELLDPQYAREGLLPIGPVYRAKNFEEASEAAEPLLDYEDVESVINAIVDEGEGITGFEGGARALLAKVQELGGARGYLEALKADQREKDKPTPQWLEEGEFLRQSHLYRFATVMTELGQENEIAERVGFKPAREPVAVDESVALAQMAEELPEKFNACYLVLLAWLSRIYEIRVWEADRSRRQAIEMLASWPLMSIAIRPLLELASFVPVEQAQLFRLDEDDLPQLPLHAQQLHRLFTGGERSEEINERMDYLAVKTLADVAAWARQEVETVEGAPIDPAMRQMMASRLRELGHLDEFEKQFPYRMHGGYSNRPPDLSFQRREPDAAHFEENPEAVKKIFEDALVLRLRFSGRGLVQLATDPDPSADEVGCTGTHMLHAADGDRRFDRALVWQPEGDPAHSIVRGPDAGMPPLGIDCREVALVVTEEGGASAAYQPSGMMNSQGEVQTSGVQQDLVVSGLHPVVALPPAEVVGADAAIRFELQPKDGQWPFQNGYNHLVWRDGEPIDPFILTVAAGKSLFQREVFNEGRPLLGMTPLQRQMSARGPWGFDLYGNIPDWAMASLSDQERMLLKSPGFPITYLKQRAGVLAGALESCLEETHPAPTQSWVDEVVSLSERMRLVSVPRGTTVAWLNILLHYGHTVSGEMTVGGGENPILASLRSRTGLGLALAEGGDRKQPNSRWLLGYTQGVMDTDGLSDLVYGELYVPLTVVPGAEPVTFARQWTFPEEVRDAVAAYACRFDAPFWADFQVKANERTTKLPDGTEITETLERQEADGYAYAMTGPTGISDYQGRFSLGGPSEAGRVTLEWKDTFVAEDGKVLVGMLSLLAGAAETMTERLRSHFGPE
ncbi:MAG TPA: ferritin-like domain-containing protein [Solirubrobacterales bacterium]|nr:ferritin-like domain-containing protein [Solirubrobacterales bacterium]